jgi:N-hydroxyarylamine O-acetyltransferase
MNIQPYLERIGFDGQPSATRDSLEALMQAHLCAIPFENLDVQLGRRLTTSADDAYEKIVDRGRGGWCYEHNGLFGWALGELGFGVTRLACAARDDINDETAQGNHLSLAVQIPGDDTTWLVDVGFGGSQFGPLPLEAHATEHEPYELRLEQLPQGRWRFTEKHYQSQSGFDFEIAPADEAALAEKSTELQTDPESSFVLNLVAQRRTPKAHTDLRGRVLSHNTQEGRNKRRLESADELVQVLNDVFDLDVPEVHELWPRVVARHEALGLG